MSEAARIGIIGCGNITSTIHLPILMNTPQARVEYLADIKRPRDLATDFGVPAIGIDDIASLPNCDIAFLATPVGVRESYIEEFGKRNIFVFGEKPFAMDEKQHLKFLSLVANASCNYMRTTFSSISQAKGMVARHLFGHLRRIIITDGKLGATGKSKTHYQMDSTLSGGGILIESGCHTLSQLTYLLQDYRFEVVTAKIKRIKGFDVDVEAVMRASAETNVEVSYHTSLIRHVTNLMTLEFDYAHVSFDHTDPASRLQVVSKEGNAKYLVELDRTRPLNMIQACFLKWSRILDAWRCRISVDSAIETSLGTTKLIDSIYAMGGLSSI